MLQNEQHPDLAHPQLLVSVCIVFGLSDQINTYYVESIANPLQNHMEFWKPPLPATAIFSYF